MKSKFWWAQPVPAVAGVSLALAIILGLDLAPFLRGGEVFRWQWPHEPVAAWRAAVLVTSLLGYGIGAARLARADRTRWLVVWAILGTLILSLVVTWIRAGNPLIELYRRTVSLTATGPYTVAGLIDWSGSEWHDWPETMVAYRELSQHVALSPPGLPLLYASASQGFDAAPGVAGALQRAFVPLQCNNYTLLQFSAGEWASAVIGMLMPAWAALAVVPLGVVARRLRVDAAWVTGSWALVPALALFAGSWNTVFPALSLVAFGLILRGYDVRRGAGWWMAAGLVSGLLTFANFSMVPLVALLGLYVLLRYALNERSARRWWFPVEVGAWFGLGLALPWVVVWLGTGSTVTAMLDVAFDRHLALDRPYVPWLWMHAWEWALFGGLPLVILGLVALWRWRPGRDVLALALFGTLALLLLSGTARGETGRVWLFLVPFALLSAGQWIAASSAPSERARSWRWVWVAQGALLAALAATWAVMGAPDVAGRPTPPPILASAMPHDARFEPGFRLVGWSADVEAGAIILRLNWQSAEQVTLPYTFAALPVAPDGTAGDSVVWQPADTRYPVTCWQPGQIVADTVRVPLPESPAPGDWFISLQAFADVENPLDTVTVWLPDGSRDRQVGLGPIEVAGAE